MKRLEHEQLIGAMELRVPKGSYIEVDDDGTAYLCIDERRLLYAGTLERLLETLDRVEKPPKPRIVLPPPSPPPAKVVPPARVRRDVQETAKARATKRREVSPLHGRRARRSVSH